MDERRRQLLQASAWGLLALGGGAGLIGCASLTGPRVLTVSEAELQSLLAREFPQQRRWLEVVEATLSAPRLRLLAERNRLDLRLVAQLQDRLTQRRWRGELGFDTALRWSVADASLRLNQVRVHTLRTLPEAGSSGDAVLSTAAESGTGGDRTAAQAVVDRWVSGIGTLLAEGLLEDKALYTASPQRVAEWQRGGILPSAVTVTARGVEISLAARP